MSEGAPGCVDMVMLKNAVCEAVCNVTECGYDYGDCGVPVPNQFISRTCFPGYVFDCSLECVSVSHIRDEHCDDGSISESPNFNCAEFYWDFGDCTIMSCQSADEPSVPDCSGVCNPISGVGDSSCDDLSTSGANFNCAEFLYDMLDCDLPVVSYIEASLGYSGSTDILDTATAAYADFVNNLASDVSAALAVAAGNIVIVSISDAAGGRRRLQTVDLSVHFRVMVEDTNAAAELTNTLVEQAADPASPLRTSPTVGAAVNWDAGIEAAP
eukprot:SAG31_NODE_8598_length_1423_cov_1.046073_1_plen_269_part_01